MTFFYSCYSLLFNAKTSTQCLRTAPPMCAHGTTLCNRASLDSHLYAIAHYYITNIVTLCELISIYEIISY